MNKRKVISSIFFAIVAGLFVMILAFSKDEKAVQSETIQERRGTYAMSAEWLNTKEAITGLQDALTKNPDDVKVMVQLAQAYIQEGRITGDHAFYDAATLELTQKALVLEPNNFEALCCQGTVLLSQHHFSEALDVALKAQTVNPSSGFVYGMLVDSYVELGNYEEAVKMCDQMMAVRPDIRSYARVSYLREIYGDLPGAIEAMQLAVNSGYPGLEQTEWCRVQLGKLYEETGALDTAKYCYEVALYNRTDYPFALAGMARIESSNGNYPQAIALLEKANEQIIEYAFYEELASLYALNGEQVKSDSAMQTAIQMLGPGTTTNEEVVGHGHYADREIALVYSKKGEHWLAIEHAIREYNRRPENIDVCESLAWVYYAAGKYHLANAVMEKAMRTGKSNPEFLCRAGLISIKAGYTVRGKLWVNEAVSMNPFLDKDLKSQANAFIQ